MESKDNSSSNDKHSSTQFCQEVGSTNSNSLVMDNLTSVGGNGDCLKCSICKKRLARKSKYIVSECIEVYLLLFVHIMCHFFLWCIVFHIFV